MDLFNGWKRLGSPADGEVVDIHEARDSATETTPASTDGSGKRVTGRTENPVSPHFATRLLSVREHPHQMVLSFGLHRLFLQCYSWSNEETRRRKKHCYSTGVS